MPVPSVYPQATVTQLSPYNQLLHSDSLSFLHAYVLRFVESFQLLP